MADKTLAVPHHSLQVSGCVSPNHPVDEKREGESGKYLVFPAANISMLTSLCSVIQSVGRGLPQLSTRT